MHFGKKKPIPTPPEKAAVSPPPEPVQVEEPLKSTSRETHTKQSLEELLRGTGQPSKKKKPVYNCKRPCEIHVRYTEAEFARLHSRVEQSCLRQADFIRQQSLEGQILINPKVEEQLAALREMNAELRRLHGELGKLGGLLKMTIKPNQEQHSMDTKSWDSLIHTTHAIFKMRTDVEKVMEACSGCLNHEFQ